MVGCMFHAFLMFSFHDDVWVVFLGFKISM